MKGTDASSTLSRLGLSVIAGRSGPRHEARLFAAEEPGLLVEAEDRLVLPTRQQHHLVAAAGPGDVHGVVQYPGADAPLTVVRMCHHILEQAVGPRGPRQIGYDGKRARRHDSIALS